MIDYLEIIKKYYAEGSDAYNLLVTHSRQVAELAVALLERKPELNISRDFVYEAAMLHDIGMFRTNAPSIFCYGELPYLRHGVEGRKILDSLGLEKHGLVCERHTGAGLSLQQIIAQQLPVPHREMVPVSLEEQVICFADKFFSKTHLDREKSVEKARRSLERYGQEGLDRFDHWCRLFL